MKGETNKLEKMLDIKVRAVSVKEKEEAKKPASAEKAKKPLSHVKDFEEDMVYLFQYTRSPVVNIYRKN